MGESEPVSKCDSRSESSLPRPASGRGWGEGFEAHFNFPSRALTTGQRDSQGNSQHRPLTLTLSPEYRGEGTGVFERTIVALPPYRFPAREDSSLSRLMTAANRKNAILSLFRRPRLQLGFPPDRLSKAGKLDYLRRMCIISSR